jgi:hypothetical protein
VFGGPLVQLRLAQLPQLPLARTAFGRGRPPTRGPSAAAPFGWRPSSPSSPRASVPSCTPAPTASASAHWTSSARRGLGRYCPATPASGRRRWSPPTPLRPPRSHGLRPSPRPAPAPSSGRCRASGTAPTAR